MNFGNWIANHHPLVCGFLLALATLNWWISYTILHQRPLLAVLYAAMALVLVVGVILTW